MTKAEPQKEHQWLQKLVGEWVGESTEPGQSPWTETGRSLDGIWVVIEGQGEMPGGGAATTIMTLGYDPQRKRYVGTFVGSMMTHLWVYDDGSLDGNVLTLHAEGPDFSGQEKLVKYRDVIEFESDDHRTLTAYKLDDDGEWREFMKATYRRKQ